MKKNITKVLSILLCLILLSGCCSPGEAFRELGRLVYGGISRSNVPDFDDMRYSRPDLEDFGAEVEELKRALDESEDFSLISELIDSCYEHYYNFDTMYTLANIRYCRDNSAAYYRDEYFWCEENFPLVQQLMDELYYACGASDIAERLEEEIFWEGFVKDYADESNSVYTDEYIALSQHESSLLAQYRELCTEPQIEYRGELTDYNELISSPVLSPARFTEIVGSYYRQYNGEFARILAELVKTRQAMALELGYESFEALQYDFAYERSYSPEDAAAYTEDIKRLMAPLYRSLSLEGAWNYLSLDGVSEEMLLDAVGGAAENMNRDIADTFEFMEEHELCDVSRSALKSAMSFETYINDYEVPYVFVDAAGNSYDILTFSHEFGHFLDGFYNFNAYETLDLSEAFSQAMEYLMLFYYEDYPEGEALDMLRRIKMLDTLDMYVNQACYAEFESRLYSAQPQELSADFINSLFLQLAVEYGLCDEGDELCAMSWCDIVHFFEMPFYVISYPVSNDAAMQIYELERQKDGEGLKKYMELLPREFSTLTESLEAAGLESPFEEGRIQKVLEDLTEILVFNTESEQAA